MIEKKEFDYEFCIGPFIWSLFKKCYFCQPPDGIMNLILPPKK